MPSYSQGPRLLKGAIVAINPATSGRRTIVSQYNRDLSKARWPHLAGGEGGERSRSLRSTGARMETIDLEVIIDAVDQLEAGQDCAAPIQLSGPLGH